MTVRAAFDTFVFMRNVHVLVEQRFLVRLLSLWPESRVGTAPAARSHTFRTYEYGCAFYVHHIQVSHRAGHVCIRIDLLETLRHDTTVHPIEIQVASVFLLEFITDRAGYRATLRIISLLEDTGVDIGRAARNLSRIT